MIEKKSDTYRQIHENIAKITVVQDATGISPYYLVMAFTKYVMAVTPAEQVTSTRISIYSQYSTQTGSSAYKYFLTQSAAYKAKHADGQAYRVMLEELRTKYLGKPYYGVTFKTHSSVYSTFEKAIKETARKNFLRKNPITLEMSQAEVAARNQRLGKISTQMWIGDILNYDFISDMHEGLVRELKAKLNRVGVCLVHLLSDPELQDAIEKMKLYEKLEEKLQPKGEKEKVKKI